MKRQDKSQEVTIDLEDENEVEDDTEEDASTKHYPSQYLTHTR